MPLSSVLSVTRAGMHQVRQASLPAADRLSLTRADLATAVAHAGPRGGLMQIILGHAATSVVLAGAGVRYLCQGEAVGEAYRRMTTAEFSRINARQAWANWRTIPRNLNGELPINRPLVVVDLCCGQGDSIRALAWWLPEGSRIVGIELDQRFAAVASAGRYCNRDGATIEVAINTGSVLDPFRDRDGGLFADRSVDLVHAIGSLGCHFTPDQTEIVFDECDRVLRGDGFALLDAGQAGTTAENLASLAQERGFAVVKSSRSWLLDRYEQLVVRRVG